MSLGSSVATARSTTRSSRRCSRRYFSPVLRRSSDALSGRPLTYRRPARPAALTFVVSFCTLLMVVSSLPGNAAGPASIRVLVGPLASATRPLPGGSERAAIGRTGICTPHSEPPRSASFTPSDFESLDADHPHARGRAWVSGRERGYSTSAPRFSREHDASYVAALTAVPHPRFRVSFPRTARAN